MRCAPRSSLLDPFAFRPVLRSLSTYWVVTHKAYLFSFLISFPSNRRQNTEPAWPSNLGPLFSLSELSSHTASHWLPLLHSPVFLTCSQKTHLFSPNPSSLNWSRFETLHSSQVLIFLFVKIIQNWKCKLIMKTFPIINCVWNNMYSNENYHHHRIEMQLLAAEQDNL